MNADKILVGDKIMFEGYFKWSKIVEVTPLDNGTNIRFKDHKGKQLTLTPFDEVKPHESTIDRMMKTLIASTKANKKVELVENNKIEIAIKDITEFYTSLTDFEQKLFWLNDFLNKEQLRLLLNLTLVQMDKIIANNKNIIRLINGSEFYCKRTVLELKNENLI